MKNHLISMECYTSGLHSSHNEPNVIFAEMYGGGGGGTRVISLCRRFSSGKKTRRKRRGSHAADFHGDSGRGCPPFYTSCSSPHLNVGVCAESSLVLLGIFWVIACSPLKVWPCSRWGKGLWEGEEGTNTNLRKKTDKVWVQAFFFNTPFPFF